MINVGVYGAGGRVGQLLVQNIINDERLALAGVIDPNPISYPLPEGTLVATTLPELLKACDLVIDFTIPEATETLLQTAMEHKETALVIGTTGLSTHQQNLLKQAGEKMPILYATNMSVGVAVLADLVYQVAKTLPDFDIEIVEMHHRYKKDAPSGTALTLTESAALGRGLNPDEARVSGRNGNVGERTKDEIAVMALRGGDIVGEHTVGFYADGEFIRLQHTATNRNTFAMGAIRAGKWLVEQNAGLYSIKDFLKL